MFRRSARRSFGRLAFGAASFLCSVVVCAEEVVEHVVAGYYSGGIDSRDAQIKAACDAAKQAATDNPGTECPSPSGGFNVTVGSLLYQYRYTSYSFGGFSHRYIGYPLLSGSCPSGQQINQTTGVCEDPPPAVDCSNVDKFSASYTYTPGVMEFCGQVTDRDGVSGKCLVKSVGVGVIIGGMLRSDFVSGGSCDGEGAAPASPPEPASSTRTCLTASDGTEVCTSRGEENCGTVNGKSVCLEKIPAGNCTFIPGGNWICASTAAAPPAPDNGTPGVKAAPVAKLSGRDATGRPGTADVFGKGAESQSSGPVGDDGSTYGSGVGDGTGEGECGGEGQPSCGETECGGEGQPPCGVKIDEEGVEEAGNLDGAFDDATSVLDDTLQSAGEVPELPGLSESDVDTGIIEDALPLGGECGAIVLNLPKGPVTIDGYAKCAPIRTGLAWVFGLAAAWVLLMLVVTAPRAS